MVCSNLTVVRGPVRNVRHLTRHGLRIYLHDPAATDSLEVPPNVTHLTATAGYGIDLRHATGLRVLRYTHKLREVVVEAPLLCVRATGLTNVDCGISGWPWPTCCGINPVIVCPGRLGGEEEEGDGATVRRWPSPEFAMVGRVYPNAREMTLGSVTTTRAPGTLFERLEKLTLSITDGELYTIAPAMPNLRKLRVDGELDAIKEPFKFPKLEYFEFATLDYDVSLRRLIDTVGEVPTIMLRHYGRPDFLVGAKVAERELMA